MRGGAWETDSVSVWEARMPVKEWVAAGEARGGAQVVTTRFRARRCPAGSGEQAGEAGPEALLDCWSGGRESRLAAQCHSQGVCPEATSDPFCLHRLDNLLSMALWSQEVECPCPAAPKRLVFPPGTFALMEPPHLTPRNCPCGHSVTIRRSGEY